jgi:hypothetical protein
VAVLFLLPVAGFQGQLVGALAAALVEIRAQALVGEVDRKGSSRRARPRSADYDGRPSTSMASSRRASKLPGEIDRTDDGTPSSARIIFA